MRADSTLMLYAGGHNDSRLLLVLFAIWVLSLFMALVFAHVVSKRGWVHTRAALYSVMLVLTLGSPPALLTRKNFSI